MANNRNGNIIFADTASKSFANDKRILGITIHVTAGTADIVLGNNKSATSYPTLWKFSTTADIHLDFAHAPMFFPDGIRIKTY